MKRLLLGLAAVMSMLAFAAAPGGAIVDGEPDEGRHPNVAMIVYYTSQGRYRCSATLVTTTVLVTAGHCTDDPVGKVIVSFDENLQVDIPRAADDPGDGTSPTGYTTAPAGWLLGTAHAHPDWTGALLLKDLDDVGVIVLDHEYLGATPATIAPLGYLDDLAAQGNLPKETFTVVGYGVGLVKPTEGPRKPVTTGPRVRQLAEAPGMMVTDTWLKLSENGKDSRGTGGSCFGDSGGAVFHGDYLVADVSFGVSQFCRGWGGYNRLDIESQRAFLRSFGVPV